MTTMTTTTKYNGRLGNQIIRNLAVSFIAKKNNLCVSYANQSLINNLGIHLFCGDKIHKETKNLTNENYFDIYNKNNIDFNLNPNNDYFQTKEISNIICTHLRKNSNHIIFKNPFKTLYNNNNNLGIHIRLTDVNHNNPGILYYLHAISLISFENLYIATDDVNHQIIKTIIKHFPKTKLVLYDEIKTIQFLSTCKNVILSHGSFSAIIGYLSFFSTIYYAKYDDNKMWYGDMFSIDGWNEIDMLCKNETI